MKHSAKEFIKNQDRIYVQNFKKKWSQINDEGVIRHNSVGDRDGYAIVLRHPREVVESFSDFASEIEKVVPSMVYQGEALHTTIALFKMKQRAAAEQGVDTNLVDIISEKIKHNITSPGELQYCGVLMNRDSVVAEGYAGVGFVNSASKILDSLSGLSEDFNLREPWGGHMTLARFRETKPATELSELFELISKNKSYVGRHVPTSIDIVYISVQCENIELTTMERYAL